jgi:hypothetical protein
MRLQMHLQMRLQTHLQTHLQMHLQMHLQTHLPMRLQMHLKMHLQIQYRRLTDTVRLYRRTCGCTCRHTHRRTATCSRRAAALLHDHGLGRRRLLQGRPADPGTLYCIMILYIYILYIYIYIYPTAGSRRLLQCRPADPGVCIMLRSFVSPYSGLLYHVKLYCIILNHTHGVDLHVIHITYVTIIGSCFRRACSRAWPPWSAPRAAAASSRRRCCWPPPSAP